MSAWRIRPALVEQHVELVDRVEHGVTVRTIRSVVAARAHQRVGAQEVVGGEFGARGGELPLVLGALAGGSAGARRGRP